MNPTHETPDCQTCGACCSAFHLEEIEMQGRAIHAVPVINRERVPPEHLCYSTSIEILIMDDDGNQVIDPLTNKPRVERTGLFIKPSADDKQCSVLEGEIGVQTRCGIYEHRPMVCKSFQPGSSRCVWARKTMKLID